VSAAHALYNPNLVTNFVNQRNLIWSRIQNSPAIFKKEDWKNNSRAEERQFVIDQYEIRTKLFDWNQDSLWSSLPILPCLHATDLSISWKISLTGFATICSLDDGYYGRGIYFTSYATYTLPYLLKPKPSILICYTTPGNPYPVVEHPRKKNSLLGTAQKPGYNSHYVLTNNKGNPCQSGLLKTVFFDELVITQESQVVPAFVLEINSGNFAALASKFNREVVENPVSAALTLDQSKKPNNILKSPRDDDQPTKNIKSPREDNHPNKNIKSPREDNQTNKNIKSPREVTVSSEKIIIESTE